MKSIKEFLQNQVLESADKSYKELFGREISMNEVVQAVFSKLGMDFRHIYDRFTVYEDGCLEYTNPYLFMGTICAKVYKHKINRQIDVNDNTMKVYPHDSFSEKDPPEFDMSSTPRYYMRAIYNALTHRQYNSNYSIVSLDYTKGDFEKDKK